MSTTAYIDDLPKRRRVLIANGVTPERADEILNCAHDDVRVDYRTTVTAMVRRRGVVGSR